VTRRGAADWALYSPTAYERLYVTGDSAWMGDAQAVDKIGLQLVREAYRTHSNVLRNVMTSRQTYEHLKQS
jgi:hypothetical protein